MNLWLPGDVIRSRSAEIGRVKSQARQMELWVLTGAFEYDDDRREWKADANPFRPGYSSVDSDGHHTGDGTPIDGGKRRWRTKDVRASKVWLPSWYRTATDLEGFEANPDLSIGDLVYTARIDGALHVLEVPYTVWAFELKDDLPILNGGEDNHPVDAYKRDWSASAHDGWGGFSTNTDTVFKVADWRKVGYNGLDGANGAAEIRHCDNGVIGVICDLECP